MNNFQFAQGELVYLLFIPALLLPLSFWILRQKYKKIALFYENSKIRQQLYRSKWKHQILKIILFSCCLVLIVISILRPIANPKVKTVDIQSRDVVFILDVSKSMLANDIKPNRLEKAKDFIQSIVESKKNERFGLIIFSGIARLEIPLSFDHDFFLSKLTSLSPDSLAIGGSNISAAIELALNFVFDEDKPSVKDLLLITDGEEHEPKVLDQARKAYEKKVFINTIGIGDPNGVKIPKSADSLEYIKNDQGAEVISRLDEETLKKIAEITKGIYIPVQTKDADFSQLYDKYIVNKASRTQQQSEIIDWQELYQYSLLLALILFILKLFIFENSRWLRKRY